MRRRRTWGCAKGRFGGALAAAALALAAFACGRLEALRTALAPQGETPVQRTTLDNGLTILLKKDHSNPIVTLDVWVNTGSMNEPPHLNGISHFLEHMMFKGTKKRPVGKVDLDIETVGGETNAGTAQDFTHYYITVASDFVSTGLDVLSDVMMNSVIDAQELESERRVILEEIRRKMDSPFSYLYDEIHGAAFRAGPYKRTVLGTMETVSSITRAQMIDYYKRYYTPDNMVLVIVGDVQPASILPRVRQYFGRFRRTKAPFEDELDRTTRRAPKSTRITQKDVRDTYTVMAFPAPGIEAPRDTIIMDVVLTIVGEGRTSRLYQSLRERRKLVTSISAGYPTQKKPGLFLVFATHDAANFEKVGAAVLQEIEQVRNRRVGRRELAKAKKMRTNEYHFNNETTNGLSDSLGLFYTLTGSEEYERRYLGEIARVTADDVRRVAQKYLDPEKVVTLTLTPKSGGIAAGASEGEEAREQEPEE